MLFYLTSLHVSYFLTDFEPVDPYMVDGQNVPTEAQMADYEKVASQWNHNEYNCRNYILNALEDFLYDIYSTFATAIWESLEKKYRTQVACSKKYVVGKFLNFKMNDAKPVVKQVEELQIIVHEMEVEDNMMNEEADTNSIEPNTNMDGKKDYTQQKNNNFKKVYDCWVYRKHAHTSKGCRHKKEYWGRKSRGNSNQANHVESPKEFACVIESFLTTNVVDWWLDTDFFENIFPYKDKEKQILNPRKRVMNDQLSQDETYNNFEVPQENVEPRRNDILIMGTNMDVINQTKKMLHSSFDMKDIGEADVILGKSTSGYVFTLGGANVSWKSSKQTVNTRLTIEAEFVALDKAAEEVEWLRNFLEVFVGGWRWMRVMEMVRVVVENGGSPVVVVVEEKIL
nr:hypothetical protein [Tanacetum cinerariifolium]